MEKRFDCPEPTCEKSFATSGHLSRHYKTHSGDKPHECPIENCTSKFSRKDNMKQHFAHHAKRISSNGQTVTLKPNIQLKFNKRRKPPNNSIMKVQKEEYPSLEQYFQASVGRIEQKKQEEVAFNHATATQLFKEQPSDNTRSMNDNLTDFKIPMYSSISGSISHPNSTVYHQVNGFSSMQQQLQYIGPPTPMHTDTFNYETQTHYIPIQPIAYSYSGLPGVHHAFLDIPDAVSPYQAMTPLYSPAISIFSPYTPLTYWSSPVESNQNSLESQFQTWNQQNPSSLVTLLDTSNNNNQQVPTTIDMLESFMASESARVDTAIRRSLPFPKGYDI